MVRFFSTSLPLGLVLLSPALTASPSFDCKSAKTPVEMSICADNVLASLDAEMGPVFSAAYVAAGRSQALLIGQRSWLSRRADCTTRFTNHAQAIGCLRGRYSRRLAFLKRRFDASGQLICQTLSSALVFADGYAETTENKGNKSVIGSAVVDVLGAMTLEHGIRTKPRDHMGKNGIDPDLVAKIRQLDTEGDGWTRDYYLIGPKEASIAVSNHTEGTLYCQNTNYYLVEHSGDLKEIDEPDDISDGCGDDLTYFGDIPSGGPEERAAYAHETPAIASVDIGVGTWAGSGWAPACKLKVSYATKLGPVLSACRTPSECPTLTADALTVATAYDKLQASEKSPPAVGSSTAGLNRFEEKAADFPDVSLPKYPQGAVEWTFEPDGQLAYALKGSPLIFRVSHGWIRNSVENDGYIVGVYRHTEDGLDGIAGFEIEKTRAGLNGPVQVTAIAPTKH